MRRGREEKEESKGGNKYKECKGEREGKERSKGGVKKKN